MQITLSYSELNQLGQILFVEIFGDVYKVPNTSQLVELSKQLGSLLEKSPPDTSFTLDLSDIRSYTRCPSPERVVDFAFKTAVLFRFKEEGWVAFYQEKESPPFGRSEDCQAWATKHWDIPEDNLIVHNGHFPKRR